jgi:hypothetical protein
MQPDLREAFAEVLHPEYQRQLDIAIERLRAAGIPFALAGGIAIGAYGEPRGTKDIDLLLPMASWAPGGAAILRPPVDVVDLPKIDLIVMPESITALELRALTTSLAWQTIPVLSPEVLAVMKLEAWRPQDRADIATLFEAGLTKDLVAEVLSLLPGERRETLDGRLQVILREIEEARDR